jgi:hypothetical protein
MKFASGLSTVRCQFTQVLVQQMRASRGAWASAAETPHSPRKVAVVEADLIAVETVRDRLPAETFLGLLEKQGAP